MSDLETFVLGYLEELGSLVEPPAFRIYEALLPEPVAERWQVDPYVQLAFSDTDREGVTQLGYNHPLVEQMVQEANGRFASAALYINDLRLDKTDLDDLAAATWVVPNARVERQKRSTVARVRHTYVRFNFKAAILTDDKQERVVSVLMDAHSGSRVADANAIESRATAVSPDTVLQSLPHASIRWQPKDGHPLKNPLDENMPWPPCWNARKRPFCKKCKPTSPPCKSASPASANSTKPASPTITAAWKKTCKLA
jgi:hypothetical protein